MPRTAAERDYLTVPEAAKVLDVSPATVWRWIAAGNLPAFRVGVRAIRIKKQDLDTVIAPALTRKVSIDKERTGSSGEGGTLDDLWAGYDPAKVRKAIAKTAGSWADLDADALIAQVYRAREDGSRAAERP